ncbi:MAG: MATE family efflux transporter [Thermoanaerobaculia bacterium]|nr:MATE family efflux transporter [Thermoanaerobaculia bacterium]
MSLPQRLRSLLQLFREAVRGEERDYTTGPLERAVFLLAIPMMLEMVLESVFAVVDVFFVAKLGPAAVATVGVTETVLTLVYAVAIGLSTATTALVARRIGEGDPARASRTAAQALMLGLLLSIAIGVAGVLGAESILTWVGASPEVMTHAGYTAVMLGGSGSVFLLFLANAIFRGAGDAAIAMRVLTVANLINIVLDPCLIFGWGPFPEMGVTGAAVATTIGRSLGVGYQVWLLARGNGRIKIGWRDLLPDVSELKGLLRLAGGGTLQYLVATASWVGMVRILAVFGDAALAGYTIAVRIVIFSILPSWGLSNAAATLVGQNLGAGQPERAETSAWVTARYNLAFLGLLAAVFLLFPAPLLGIFTSDPEVIRIGASCLRWIASCYGIYAFGLVMIQALNGAGDTNTPTLINFVAYWVWQIPFAWYAAQVLGWGPNGVFIAIASAETLLAVLAIWVFRRGAWKLRQV